MDSLIRVTLTKEGVGRLINFCQDMATEGSAEYKELKLFVETATALEKALTGEDPHQHLGGFGIPCPGCGTILRYEVGMALVECKDCNTKGRVKFSWEPTDE